MKYFLTACSIATILMGTSSARADDYTLTLTNHQYEPKEITLPADQKIKLVVRNLDSTPAEFESSDLGREKIVPAHGEATILLGPLSAGHYSIFDDFHRDSTTGTIIVK